MTSGIAQLSAPKNALWMPNSPKNDVIGPSCELKIRSHTRPTTVTPSAIGRNTSSRPTAANFPLPLSLWAKSRPMTFCPRVTATTNTNVATTAGSKPASSVENIDV